MALVGHPFDTIKTRIQADTIRAYRSTLQCATDTMQKEGMLALWRGIGPALLSTALTGAIRFGVQAAANKQLAKMQGVPHFSDLGLPTRVLMEASGGFAAGLVLPVFFTPIELVKVHSNHPTLTPTLALTPNLTKP